MARVSNLGYMAMKKETTKGTAVTPDTYVPLYEESLTTRVNHDDDDPIVGFKSKRFNVYPGQRDHQGNLKVLAEPNTAAKFIDMLLTHSGTSGAGDPYTHSFGLSSTTDPKAYTIDISRSYYVDRFIGVEAKELGVAFEDNKMVFEMGVSALKSFTVREIDSVSTTTITLKDNYDPSPTTGLVASDLIGFYDVSAGTFILDKTVASVTNGTVFEASAEPSGITAGDLVFLRPASSPSLATDYPFLWSRTEFRFGVDASTALSATHTPLDSGSLWKIMHEFVNDEGEKRSGSFDPAELLRLNGDVEFTAKKTFIDPVNHNAFNTIAKKACVIRHFSESNHEIRLTLNNLKLRDPFSRPLSTQNVMYEELTFAPTYDSSDGQMFDVKVINENASV